MKCKKNPSLEFQSIITIDNKRRQLDSLDQNLKIKINEINFLRKKLDTFCSSELEYQLKEKLHKEEEFNYILVKERKELQQLIKCQANKLVKKQTSKDENEMFENKDY